MPRRRLTPSQQKDQRIAYLEETLNALLDALAAKEETVTKLRETAARVAAEAEQQHQAKERYHQIARERKETVDRLTSELTREREIRAMADTDASLRAGVIMAMQTMLVSNRLLTWKAVRRMARNV